MRRLGGLAVLVAALAACGGEGAGGEPAGSPPVEAATPIAAAAAATAEETSYRSSIVLEYESADGPVRIAGEGEFQAEPARGRLTMTVAQAGSQTDVAGTEIVYDGRVLYMAAPGREAAGGDETWIAMDLGEAGRIGQLAGFDRTDPAQALAYLRAGGEAEEVGAEEVRGAQTTHYRLTIDLEEAAAGSPEYRAVIEQGLEAGGSAEVPADVWVDEDGRVRRVRMTYADVPTLGGVSADVTVTIELYDFGADVAIEPPPRDRVLNLGQDGGGGSP